MRYTCIVELEVELRVFIIVCYHGNQIRAENEHEMGKHESNPWWDLLELVQMRRLTPCYCNLCKQKNEIQGAVVTLKSEK